MAENGRFCDAEIPYELLHKNQDEQKYTSRNDNCYLENICWTKYPLVS